MSVCLRKLNFWRARRDPDRELMLFCDVCHNWFHQDCVAVVQERLLPGDWGYRFVCGDCNSGNERFGQIEKSWQGIVQVVMFNCVKARRSNIVHVSEHVVKLLDKHFKSVRCTIKISLHNTDSASNRLLLAKHEHQHGMLLVRL